MKKFNGIRYMPIEKQRINIGIDTALGKDDWGVYFRIGESFAGEKSDNYN